MRPETIDHLSPLAADVRAEHPDRYMATLFAPPASRNGLFALYAFDHEIARVQTVVREPMAGLIRLQWWQDVVDGLGKGDTIAHPVVRGLRAAIADDGLNPAYLERAIDGRRRPFESDLPPDQETFERYLRDIGGSITSAAASLLGIDGPEAMALAERIGFVVAASDQWRLLERSSSDRKPWLPSTGMEIGDVDPSDDPYPLQKRSLAERALEELRAIRRQQQHIARSTLAAFFPGTLAAIRLGDPSGPSGYPQQTIPLGAATLLWYWLRGRF